MGRRSPGPVGFEQAIAATIRPVATTLMIPDRRNRMTYRSNDAWIETRPSLGGGKAIGGLAQPGGYSYARRFREAHNDPTPDSAHSGHRRTLRIRNGTSSSDRCAKTPRRRHGGREALHRGVRERHRPRPP